MGLPRYLKEKEKEFLGIAKFTLLNSHALYILENQLDEFGVADSEKLTHKKFIKDDLKIYKGKASLLDSIRTSFKEKYKLGQYQKEIEDWEIFDCCLIKKTYIQNNIQYVKRGLVFKLHGMNMPALVKKGYCFYGVGRLDAYIPLQAKIRHSFDKLIDKREARNKQKEKIAKAKNKVFNSRIFPATLRQIIFQRDNYCCQLCGIHRDEAIKKGRHLEIDHITEWENGGETTYENGQTLCSDCNKAKFRVKRLMAV